MIVEKRTYTLAVGATGRYFKLYEERGLDVQRRILGHLVGYYAVEFGTLNTIVHLWAYPDLETRDRRREVLWRDPDWRACAKELSGIVVAQQSEILKPAPFFQIPAPA